MSDGFCRVKMMAFMILVIISATMGIAQQEGQSSFWVENPDLELGKILAGQTIVATYVFHNDGPSDVNIIRAKPS